MDRYPNDIQSNQNDVDMIDFKEISSALWRSKNLILLIAAVTTALALLASSSISKYKSEGYFQFEMSFADFKRLQSAIAAPLRWQDFAKTLSAAQQSNINGDIFKDNNQLQTMVEPIFPITKAEMKDIPNAAMKDITNDIAGLKISYKAKTADDAQQNVVTLGHFLRDTAIILNFQDVIRTHLADYKNTQSKYENDTIQAKYDIEQLEIQKENMQKILHQYPDAARLDNRQLVTVTDGNERFLSPVTQLVAIETDMAEKQRDLPRITRDQHINDINLRYYQQLQELINKSTSGTVFLAALPTIKDQLKLNMKDEVERSVYNNITMDDMQAQAKYFEKTYFIATPSLPSKPTPGLTRSALVGLLIGLILGSIFVLIRYFYSKPDEIKSTHTSTQ